MTTIYGVYQKKDLFGGFSSIVEKLKNYTDNYSCSINDKFLVFNSDDNGCNSIKVKKTYRVYGYILDDLPDEISVSNVKDIEGEFVILQETSNKILLVNDRYASRPFFYFESDELLIFSNNINLIIETIPTSKLNYDRNAIYSFLKYGHYIEDETYISSIKRLKPGSFIDIDKENGFVDFKSYYNLSYKIRDELNIDTVAKELNSAFIKAVNSRVELFKSNKSCIFQLSGGLDSRIMVGSLAEQNKGITALTLDGYSDDDLIVAKDIVRRLGIKHITPKVSNSGFKESLSLLIKTLGGMTPLIGAFSNIPCYRAIDNKGIVFGAWAGDVLAGSYIEDDILLCDEDKVNKAYKHFSNNRGLPHGFISQVYKSSNSRHVDKSIRNKILNRLKSYNAPTGGHGVTLWAMEQRQPAFSFQSPAHFNSEILEVSPCLSYEFNDILLSLPIDYLYSKNMYKYYIYKKLDELRDVIYANTGKKLNGSFEKITHKPSFSSRIKHLIPAFIKRQIKLLTNKRVGTEYDKIVLDHEILERLIHIAKSNEDKFSEIFDSRRLIRFLFKMKTNTRVIDNDIVLYNRLQTIMLVVERVEDIRKRSI